MTRRLTAAPRLALATGLAAIVVSVPAWGGLASASSPTTTVKYHTVAPKKQVLSGTWTGSYSGSFSGTFKLTWKESGTALSGTIMISGFGNTPTSIHGTVNGRKLSFGTVGSRSITYSGSVSSTSMSGTWTISAAGHSMGGGSWKASKA